MQGDHGNGANDEDSLIIDGFAMPGPSAKVSLGVMIILPPVHRVRGALPAVEPPIAPSVCKEIIATDVSASASRNKPKAIVGSGSRGGGGNLRFVACVSFACTSPDVVSHGIRQGSEVDQRCTLRCLPKHYTFHAFDVDDVHNHCPQETVQDQ